MNSFYKLHRREQYKIIVIISLMTVFYAAFRHFIRPALFSCFENGTVRFLLDIFPNFWGIFILYPLPKYFLDMPLKKSMVYLFILAVSYEVIEIYDCGTKFDIFDILASAVAIFIIYIYEKKVHKL